jgi:heme iron utilization protein
MTSKGKASNRATEGPGVVPERLRMLNSIERFAVLATQEEGRPYASLVAYALSSDLGTAVFATPKNTRKYRNIVKTDEVALLLDNRSQESPIAKAEAITLTGRAKPLRKGREREELTALYLAKHQDLKDFVESPSTALVALRIDQAVHVGNFQTVTSWRPGRQE